MPATFRSVLAVVAVFTLAGPVLAQGEGLRRFRESVALATNGSVTKQLAAVRDYLNDRQWPQAFDLIGQVTDAHGDTLISVSPGRYVNVALYGQMLLAGLPGEGLAEYRRRIDPQARQWFLSGRDQGDRSALRQIVRQAFVSSYGDDAVLLLGEAAWERGDVSAARSLWTQALPLRHPPQAGQPLPALRYPDTDRSQAEILGQLVLCSVLEGNLSRARRELAVFEERHPDATGHLAGQDGKLAEILKSTLSDATTWTYPSRDADVSTFSVRGSRNARLPGPVDVGAPLWSRRLPRNRFDVPHRQPALKDADRGPLSYYPLVFGDMVLLHDGQRVSCFDIITGKAYWPRTGEGGPLDAVIYPPVPDLPDDQLAHGWRFSYPVVGVPRYTMTLSEGRLYVRTGAPVTAWHPKETAQLRGNERSRLVCLDLVDKQGAIDWQMSPADVTGEANAWSFEGSPSVRGERAYVALRRRHPQVQTNVACLDADTGKVIWNRKVCVAVTNIGEGQNFLSHNLLTRGGNSVFYSTDLGAIAALNMDDGTLRWVVTYESRQTANTRVLSDHTKIGLIPCVYHQGTVFASPNDADGILAIDAQSGVIKWRQPVIDRIRHLMGVAQGVLIAGGNSLWGLDAETGAVRWGQKANERPETYGYGHGLLAGDTVWWPTRQGIEVRDQQSGRIVRRINLMTRGLGGGNLALGADRLIVAEPDRLSVLSQTGGTVERLKEDVSANPRSARLQFRVAQADEGAGRLSEADQRYRQAAERAGTDQQIAGQTLRQAALRRRFRLLLRQAVAAAKQANPKETTRPERAWRDAIAAAPGPVEKASVLLRLAGWYESLDQPGLAVNTYQQMLSDPALRSQTLAAPLSQPAGRVAQTRISALIERHGRGVYSQVEAKAERRFPSLLSGGNPDRVAELLDRFPHAGASARAVLASAGRAHQSGQIDTAVRLLRRASRLPLSPDDRRSVSHALARFQQRAGIRDESDSARYRLTLPFRRNWQRPLPAPALFPEGAAPSEDTESVLVSGHRLQCVSLADGQVRWERFESCLPLWAVYAGMELLIGNSRRVKAVGLADGRTRWERTIGPSSKPEKSRPPQFALYGGRLYWLEAGRVVAVDSLTGRLLWSFQPEPEGLSPDWLCTGQFLAVQLTSTDRLVVLDAADGRRLYAGAGSLGRWSARPVRVAGNGLALVGERRSVRLLDLATQSTSWTYAGAMSFANADPCLVADGENLVLVIDGDTLCRVSVKDGRPVWARGFSSRPVRRADQLILLDRTAIAAVGDGILRSFRLSDGRLRWERYVGRPDLRWKAVGVGDHVLAHPVTSSAQATVPIVICEANSGVPVQRLRFKSDGGPVRFRAGGSASVALVGRTMFGLTSF